MFKFKNESVNKIIFKISIFLDTPFFAISLAAVELFCFYLKLDIAIIAIISLLLSFTFLFKENVNCLLTIFLFMSSMISVDNSPANIFGNCNFYFEKTNVIFCIVAACIPVISATLRAIFNFAKKRIKLNALSISTIVFGTLLLTNGLTFKNYNFMNLLFGLFMFFFFVILYFAISPDIYFKEGFMKKNAIQAVIYGLTIVFELGILYLTIALSENSFNYRNDIFLGWGNENTIGMVLTICLCFLLYLFSIKEDRKLKFFCYSSLVAILIGILATFSRQAYLFVFLLLAIYLLVLSIKKSGAEKRKYILLLSIFSICILTALLIIAFSGSLDSIVFDIIHDERFTLWENALASFKDNILFGGGFYYSGGDPTVRLTTLMPYCCHNTVFQLIGACGLFGIASYGIYRFFTIKHFFKNFSFEKMFPALACFSILMLSLLDIHLFDFFGTALYVTLLAQATSETQVEKNKNLIEINEDIKNEVKE